MHDLNAITPVVSSSRVLRCWCRSRLGMESGFECPQTCRTKMTAWMSWSWRSFLCFLKELLKNKIKSCLTLLMMWLLYSWFRQLFILELFNCSIDELESSCQEPQQFLDSFGSACRMTFVTALTAVFMSLSPLSLWCLFGPKAFFLCLCLQERNIRLLLYSWSVHPSSSLFLKQR